MRFYKYAMIAEFLVALGMFLFVSLGEPAFAQLDEFDITNSLIDVNDFIGGGPEKDGIPFIDEPVFVSAKKADFLKDDDNVIGVSIGKEARAYPLKILNWHEVVNDVIAGMPIAVTWCPLTKSAVVFEREIDNEVLTFGVSGLLYNSNLVFYDRNSNSLWPQLALGAVTGKFSSQNIPVIPSRVVTWRQWKKEHHQTLLLSGKTGFPRDYSRDPYAEYHRSEHAMFPLKHADTRLPPKTLVIGIEVEGIAKAYSIDLIKNKSKPVEDTIGLLKIKIFAGSDNTAYITDEEDDLLPAVTMYWFAWSSFNRGTLLYGE
ncbi:MAG: hypothetical protein COW92_01030 [Candidatus Omnitrophica bacterium CG22_combo_CG10-13_8_21_14_all_43_16]|nr:MAG: hypothetical protein COW92_01030 [Candidatus Omnitrophica bacterium CG22_combo_CG10-13_8_21_14_all_43_16]